jgi:hypothetical protein
MRGFLQSLSVGLLLIISVAKPATADPIRVTLDARNVAVVAKVNDLPGRSSEIAPQDVFVSFDEAVTVADAQGSVSAQSTATQRSSLTPLRYRAIGAVETLGNAPDAGSVAFNIASSVFATNFDLAIPSRFLLTDSMTASAFQSNGVQNTDALVQIVANDGSGTVFLKEGVVGTGSRQVNAIGFLPAGSYEFFAEAVAQGELNGALAGATSHHAASFDLDFQLTPTPEPGSILLVGSGLVAFTSRRVTRAVHVRR